MFKVQSFNLLYMNVVGFVWFFEQNWYHLGEKKTGEWHNNVESVVMIKVRENEERGKFGRV